MDTPRLFARLSWNPNPHNEWDRVRVTEVFRTDSGLERLHELGCLRDVRSARRLAVRHGLKHLDETKLGIHNFGD